MGNKLNDMLKKRILSIVDYARSALSAIEEKLVTSSDSLFEDLTPKNNIEDLYKYDDAFDFAIKNKRIKNLAVTGPYGAGKSSVLKSYFENRKWIKTLNISLASFCNQSSEKLSKEEMEALEKSILQQMFYRVKFKKIPATGFRRIIAHKPRETFFIMILIVTSVLGTTLLIRPSLLDKPQNIINQFLKYGWNTWQVSFFVLVVFMALFSISITAINYSLNNVSFRLLKTKLGDVEMNKSKTESLFNRNIDEILYFFEVTDFEVVVFEDIDRFSDENIFVKLRELNTLINSSEQISRRILFIYAVRDDIFLNQSGDKSRSRTKFFDFIIPIIPVVHTTNSSETMISKFEELDSAWRPSKEAIRNMGIHIGDMRVIINICNEFIMYREKIGCHLIKSEEIQNRISADKLLGMVVYKNMFPDDFAKLQDNNGNIVEAIKQKNEHINKIEVSLDERIAEIESTLRASKNELDYSEEELRSIYVYGIRKRFGNQDSIRINGSNYSIWELMKPEYFEEKREGIQIHSWQGESISKENLFTVFNTKQPFNERLISVQSKLKERETKLLNELQSLRNDKEALKRSSLKDLITNHKNCINVVNENKLLNFLISYGYIDERYQDYMTYFKEGILSINDHLFLLSIKDQKSLPFDHKINNATEVSNWLSQSEYSRVEILNFDLFNYLLSNNVYKEFELKSFLNICKLETAESRDFIWSFWKTTYDRKSFGAAVVAYWPNYIDYLIQSNYSDKEIMSIIIEFMMLLSKEELIILNQNKLLTNYISSYTKLLSDIEKTSFINPYSIAEKLEALEVRFSELEEPSNLKLIEQIVFAKKLFNFTPVIISSILKSIESKCDYKKIYTSIRKSNNLELNRYIDDNIEEFLKNAMIAQQQQLFDDEKDLIILYNNEKISAITKEKLIQIEYHCISNLEVVKDDDVLRMLLNSIKVNITWSNVYDIYQRFKMDDEVCDFLNKPKVKERLILEELIIGDNNSENQVLKLYSDILLAARINDDSVRVYSSILQLTEPFEIETVDEDRISLLMELGKFELSEDLYQKFKQYFPEYCIRLIEKNIEVYIGNYEKYTFRLTTEDFKLLLADAGLGLLNKSNLIKVVLFSGLYSEDEITEVLNIKFNIPFLLEVLSSDLDYQFKCKVLFSQVSYHDRNQIMQLMKVVGGGLEKIANASKQITLRDNEILDAHLAILKQIRVIANFEHEENSKVKIKMPTIRIGGKQFSQGDL